MIELKNVTKKYPRGDTGLQWESVTIPTGEIVGILGENGSGKTTLLKAIMGLGELQNGEIRIDGRPVGEQYERMAFITEEGSFFPNMTPYENMQFLADYYPGFQTERYQKLLKYFQIPAHEKARTLSKGQKAKLEVCIGFSKNAKYILMDEPFLGNDVFTRRDFLKLMITSLKSEETILIATHLVDEIEHVIDRAIILRYGRVKAELTMDEIHQEGKNLEEILLDVIGYKEDRYKQFF